MLESSQDCSICSDINCSNCPTAKQLGIAFAVIAPIITALVGAGSTVYTVQSQKKLAEKQRKQAEEDLKALQELEKQKQQAQLDLKMLELSKPSFLTGIDPTTMILIGTGLVFVFMLMSILRR